MPNWSPETVCSSQLKCREEHVYKLTVNQGHARAIRASLADTVKVAIKELGSTNLQALLHNLGSKLVHAVFGGETDNVVNCPSAIRRVTMLADVLDAPVAKLTVSDDVNAGEDFVDARTLWPC